jgi:hypothetical protein
MRLRRVNAIKQRTGDPLLIFCDKGIATGIGPLTVPVEPTEAGMYTIELLFPLNQM